MALALALFALTTLALASASALLVGTADVKATRNYRGASEVHLVAESAIAQAMQIVNGPGILNFQTEVVTQWTTLFGTGTRTFAPMAGYTYSVSAFADLTDPANAGQFVATADGPEGAHNVVVARVTRTNVPNAAPGAVYIAQDSPTNSTFTGNAFHIDGNDHNYTGGAGPGPAIPGISTRNATNTQEAISSLSNQQLDNVTGLGFLAGPPIVPSVMTSGWAPSVSQVNQIATDLLSLPGVVTLLGGHITGNLIFGTLALPQITHFTSSTDLKANGNASGAGIMIVDGDLTIQGNLSYKGLIIVRGQTSVVGDTEVTGNATVYGGIWTNDVNLNVGGSGIIYYSSQALALANLVSGGAALPSPIQVVSLADCADVGAGANTGCP